MIIVQQICVSNMVRKKLVLSFCQQQTQRTITQKCDWSLWAKNEVIHRFVSIIKRCPILFVSSSQP